MPKKNKPVEEVKPEPVVEEVEFVPVEADPVLETPDLVEVPADVSTPAMNNKLVRVRNQGKPFLCDLTAYGYGTRWPTGAVYAIPTVKYLELLKQGLDGVSA